MYSIIYFNEINMKKEFTATVYILEDQRVLLLYHPKLSKWLPPGGHVEPDETPPEAARREVLEETGLEIDFLTQENVWVNYWNAISFERPYLCLLEDIPAYKDHPPHYHMDFVYVGRPRSPQSERNMNSEQTLRWFSLEDLAQLKPDQEIFSETLHVLRHLFEAFKETLTTTH